MNTKDYQGLIKFLQKQHIYALLVKNQQIVEIKGLCIIYIAVYAYYSKIKIAYTHMSE